MLPLIASRNRVRRDEIATSAWVLSRSHTQVPRRDGPGEEESYGTGKDEQPLARRPRRAQMESWKLPMVDNARPQVRERRTKAMSLVPDEADLSQSGNGLVFIDIFPNPGTRDVVSTNEKRREAVGYRSYRQPEARLYKRDENRRRARCPRDPM